MVYSMGFLCVFVPESHQRGIFCIEKNTNFPCIAHMDRFGRSFFSLHL